MITEEQKKRYNANRRAKHLENPEARRARDRAFHARHRARRNAKMAAYRQANLEAIRAADRARYHADVNGLKERRLIHSRRYRGINHEEAEKLLARAKRCAICGGTNTKLVPDHDHQSGKLRGALCHKHNLALGGFNDSPKLLAAAIKYLKKHAS